MELNLITINSPIVGAQRLRPFGLRPIKMLQAIAFGKIFFNKRDRIS
jgi:hypothetical protein